MDNSVFIAQNIKHMPDLIRQGFILDKIDQKLIAALRHNARASVSELAARVGVTRTTLRSRLEKLEQRGEIIGYSVITRADVADVPVRALMMLTINGHGADRVLARLSGIPEVAALHTTNGKWDMVVEINTQSLAMLDSVLSQIRRFEGVSQSETSILLKTRKAAT